jgi:hypothetical protein
MVLPTAMAPWLISMFVLPTVYGPAPSGETDPVRVVVVVVINDEVKEVVVVPVLALDCPPPPHPENTTKAVTKNAEKHNRPANLIFPILINPTFSIHHLVNHSSPNKIVETLLKEVKSPRP